jgi:hypothetical protein
LSQECVQFTHCSRREAVVFVVVGSDFDVDEFYAFGLCGVDLLYGACGAPCVEVVVVALVGTELRGGFAFYGCLCCSILMSQ